MILVDALEEGVDLRVDGGGHLHLRTWSVKGRQILLGNHMCPAKRVWLRGTF